MGKIKDQTTGELLPFVRITLIQHDTIKYVGETDFDGHYKIKEVKPGIYNVKTTVIGYYSKEINSFLAKGSMINFLNIELNPEPLIEPDYLPKQKVKKRRSGRRKK